jgi:hypothetical protein
MEGFKIAIATEDKELEDLICIGTDLSNFDQGAEESKAEAKIIESVDILFDTIDNDVRQKSSSMLTKIVIKGKILKAPALTKKLRKLSEWARDSSSETAYRDICIAVKEGATSFQVVYTLKKVFVVDYQEVYALVENASSFELHLTQREDSLNEINVLSDWPSDWNWARKG